MHIRMTPEEFFDKCLLISYGETDFDNFGKPMDCYGLVYWFYKLCLGIELQRAHVKKFSDASEIKYIPVETPADGDVVYMVPLLNDGAPHVGVYWHGVVGHQTYEGFRANKLSTKKDSIRGYFHYVDARKDS